LTQENKKSVVYTCLTGNYDNLIQLSYVDNDWDYICFTDNPSLLKQNKAGIWNIRPLVFNNLNKSKNNRWHKIHALDILRQYNESIYIDANVNILTSYFFDMLKSNRQDMLVPMHHSRDCIYVECEVIISTDKDSEKVCRSQIDYIRSTGFPSHYGLNENNIIYRKHGNQKTRKLMEEWWQFIEKYSTRDQLSFSYVLWNNGIQIKSISFPNIRYDKINFSIETHKQKWKGKLFHIESLPSGRKRLFIIGKKIFSF